MIPVSSFKPPPPDVANSNPGALSVTDTLVEHYAAWFAVMQRMIAWLDISKEEVDAVCGLANGQYDKLLRKGTWGKSKRRAGAYVMFAMANNLGFDTILRINQEKLDILLKTITRRKNKRWGKHGLGRERHDTPQDSVIRFGADQLRLNGAKGGRARAAMLSPAKKRRIARRAARIRWANRAPDTSPKAKPASPKHSRRPRGADTAERSSRAA